MSRFAALNTSRSPRKPLPKWKMVLKLVLFSGIALALFWGWFSYSGQLARAHKALIHRYELYQKKMGFEVNKIIIHGRHKIPKTDILKALEVTAGDPYSRFDLELAYSQLSQHPWVKSVIIQRQWPDTIHVIVKERVPLALWQYHQKVVLIDETGEVLTSHIEPYKTFPLVMGLGAPQSAHQLFRVLKNYPDLQKKITAAIRIGNRRWDLRLKEGPTVMLPEDDYNQSLKILEGLEKKIQIFEKAKKVIDLRFPKKMIMR